MQVSCAGFKQQGSSEFTEMVLSPRDDTKIWSSLRPAMGAGGPGMMEYSCGRCGREGKRHQCKGQAEWYTGEESKSSRQGVQGRQSENRRKQH